MEESSSTKNNDFISKSMATNTYAVARRLGAGYGFGADNWSINASYFGRELTRNLAHGSGYGLRGTWAPINDKGNILNFGLEYANYDTDSAPFLLRARPHSRSHAHLVGPVCVSIYKFSLRQSLYNK